MEEEEEGEKRHELELSEMEADVALRERIDKTTTTTRDKRQTVLWNIFGKKVPRSQMVFILQMVLIYIVVVASIINLSLDSGASHLWIALLSSSLGYILPNPTLEPASAAVEV